MRGEVRRKAKGRGEGAGGERRVKGGEEGGEIMCSEGANTSQEQTHEFLSISNTSYSRTTFGCSNFLCMLYSRRACLAGDEGKHNIHHHSSPMEE